MKLGSLKYLMIVFVLLLAGVVGLFIYDRTQQTTDTTAGVTKTELFTGINLDALNKITIKKGDKNVNLTIGDNQWKVNDKPADQTQIKQLVDELKNTYLYDLVSKNPENQKDLSVDEENGLEIIVEQGNGKVSFYAGGYAGPSAFYLRKSGENEVYLSRSRVNTVASVEEAKWRDKTIVNVDFSKVSKIEASGGKKVSVYKNKEDKWVTLSGRAEKELVEDDITKLTTAFSPLDAYGFATEDDVKTYDTTKGKVTIKLWDSENNVLAEFETVKVEDNYMAKISTGDDLFKIYASKLDFLFELSQ